MFKKSSLHFLLLLFVVGFAKNTTGQCIRPTKTSPFLETFEANDGNWTPGGNGSDWAWGTPSKSVINKAGGGNNCWVVGGLTGNGYTNGESSWLQSPCFDFSALQHPAINFLVFWEMERRYDGANLQYSTDQGNSWQNVGSSSDAINCFNENWYNASNVTYLTGTKEGWSGNIQSTSGSCQGGNGSGGWVLAKKTLPQLAGLASVSFRFFFGAGTQCNNFNGFAIDEFAITEMPPNVASFTYLCAANRTIDFTSTSSPCPQVFKWTFGDPSSGNNSASIANPSHTFSSPGIYTIALTVEGPDNEPSTITKQVQVLEAYADVQDAVSCGGDKNGSVTVQAIGGNGIYNYSWNTNPEQTTQTAINLSAGTYTVTATAQNACPATATVILAAPAPLQHQTTVVQPGCTSTTGSINIIETGGSPGYTYSWSPAVSASSSANNLQPGKYTITVTDAAGCKDIIDITLIATVRPDVIISTKKDVTCKDGNDGSATAKQVAANGTVTYSWNTDPVQNNITAINLIAGQYIVTMTDANGCFDTASVIINEPAIGMSVNPVVTNTTCELKNGGINLVTQNGTSPYSYNWSPSVSTTASATNIAAGNYAIQVKDQLGCLVNVNLVVANNKAAAKPNLGADISVCANQTNTLDPGIFSTYRWQDNSTTNKYNVTTTGKYYVTVTNADGCVGSDTVNVEVRTDCGDLYFPGSFSPNNDSRNDLFGALGNYSIVTNYSLIVYNRYGQKVFATNDPTAKWDGRFNGAKQLVGTYAWYASYTLRGYAKRTQKGTVVIIK